MDGPRFVWIGDENLKEARERERQREKQGCVGL